MTKIKMVGGQCWGKCGTVYLLQPQIDDKTLNEMMATQRCCGVCEVQIPCCGQCRINAELKKRAESLTRILEAGLSQRDQSDIIDIDSSSSGTIPELEPNTAVRSLTPEISFLTDTVARDATSTVGARSKTLITRGIGPRGHQGPHTLGSPGHGSQSSIDWGTTGPGVATSSMARGMSITNTDRNRTRGSVRRPLRYGIDPNCTLHGMGGNIHGDGRYRYRPQHGRGHRGRGGHLGRGGHQGRGHGRGGHQGRDGHQGGHSDRGGRGGRTERGDHKIIVKHWKWFAVLIMIILALTDTRWACVLSLVVGCYVGGKERKN